MDELGQFYDDMGFKQLRAQLGTTSSQEEAVLDFQIVTEISPAMLKQDQFFYFEILGENYHREDLVGLAWGIRRKFMSEGLSYLIVQSCVNF